MHEIFINSYLQSEKLPLHHSGIQKKYSAASHKNSKERIHTCARHCGLCGSTRGPTAAWDEGTWDQCEHSEMVVAQVELAVSAEEKCNVY